MSAPLMTVVVPIRNRSGVRLENCLRSLRWQEGVSKDDIEILISDFGSEPEHRDAVAQIAATYAVRVHYTPASGLWNRSRALNIGIKRANGDYTLCTDVDMVFAPNFLRVLLDTQKQFERRGLLMCQYHDLGEETLGRVIALADLEMLKKSGTMRPVHGMGGCQCAETQWFHKIHGFDEGYTYWGAEDTDLARRAEFDRRQIHWVTEKTSMLHQWHPTAKHDKPWQLRKNKWRLTLTGWIVKKNWLGWGE